MNTLADIIVAKLMEVQKKLDESFFEAAKNAGVDLSLNVVDTDAMIKDLENQLQEAIQQEKYELAAQLVEKLNELKNL